MKNVLIIVSHPKVESLTRSLANRYRELAEQKGERVVFIDLYRSEYQQGFFTYDDANAPEKSPEVHYYQDAITKADEIVFFFPYWWGSFPAILKNFFDWNLSRGFAFEYVDSRPKGMLVNKSVKIFTTTGAPKFIYTLTGANRRLKNMFKEQIVGFCGMKLESCNIYGGVDTSGKNVDKIFDDLSKRV